MDKRINFPTSKNKFLDFDPTCGSTRSVDISVVDGVVNTDAFLRIKYGVIF